MGSVDRPSSVRGSCVRDALHVAALSALAFAHPIFEVVRRDSEFLVAHRIGRPDLLLFVLTMVVVVPALPVLVAWLVGRLFPVLQRAVILGTIFVLSALLAIQALNAIVEWPTAPAVAGAIACAALLTSLYWRFASIRTYVSLLGLAILLVPAVFLLDGSVAGFWREVSVRRPPAPPANLSTPIVLIVFDQFPTVSLLDESGQIDARLFPSLAGLARHSTWYRNATAVSDRTGFAMPAIVTGRYPRKGQLPRTQLLPDNLFTWLGQRYRVWAREPLTALCPPDICESSVGSVMGRLGSMMSDVAAVYMHIVAPTDLRDRLPPVNQGWRNFKTALWKRRFVQQRAGDRRAPLLELIDALEPPTDRPTLYFGHVLLPHEPFIYYPSGRIFAGPDEPILGLGRSERWTTDPWPVALSYQRHLQQVRMVDGLIGSLVERMRAVGLYDRALLVITADHGASFRPGQSFKGPFAGNFAEIMSVPLLVKAPGQVEARVDDTNIETIDVLPTIADAIGATVPWETHGGPGRKEARRTDKRLCHSECTVWQVRTPEAVRDGRQSAVAEKLRLFGSPADPDRQLVDPALASLLGRSTDSLAQPGEPGWRVQLDLPWRAEALTSVSSFVPGLLSGVARPSSPTQNAHVLAVALDGVVRGLAPLYRPKNAETAVWAVLLPERFAAGNPKRLEIFEVLPRADTDAGFALRRAYSPGQEAADVNLVSVTAQSRYGVKATGFYPPENIAPGRVFRWTEARARLEVPIDPNYPVRQLALGLCQDGPVTRPLRIRVNHCQLFAGTMPMSPWRGRFPIDESCVSGESTVTIELSTDPFVPRSGDRRELGAAVDYIALTR
jgi:hypothetical protein